MRWACDVQIEDLRDHPTELVVQLCHLLASGAPAIPDPKHPELYEIRSDTQVFYVHISPVSGKYCCWLPGLRRARWKRCIPQRSSTRADGAVWPLC